MSPDMSVALISRGTTAEQLVVVGTLSDICAKVAQNRVEAPTLVIIGEVVRLRNKLDWMAAAQPVEAGGQ
jgi:uroporphyrin-III C-methyltransferase/precorrin-2 dehydrogenase/sirohydrochlorin ferrochelatase/uroporphyrin-III C-methyltransferase